ncbi:hypothetical protein ACE5JW_01850 [Acinetobacter radioresistens]|uniref:Uncharacterized protein n=1 Tax=Acinetobacter radioresistens SK82 TaxID=596318 RepID=A0ABP2GKQ2_ACIRA|nr:MULTISPECIES: hypothetical protein [Acinetobacter]AWV87356.1 hypothetical protein DOM24_12495 [Acinetobacter radioresistens]EET82298.1 hypothetical protein ACIRA0001_2981 [Acinetobacter radioresistens SK82]EEY85662.1 hypothetical protein HMPREF0018_02242 [Acinetobacter radioresistens SH164]ENV85791.1 hypothetical protein F940_02022 [Acinetobacter radioresistens NIPH 2130]EXB80953.1 hypothetical protein J538_2839 [Acinetobacter sp. 272263]
MPRTLISNISKRIRQVYQKAEGFIEEEREFALSQVFLNATFERYVTNNVKLLQDLHADVHDDWLRLYATLEVKGLYTTLSVDLKLLQMELNKNTQLLIFEQISDTQVIEAKFKNVFIKIGFNTALFFYQKILRKDPLGSILERFNIVQVKDDLLYLDLNQWLGKSRSVLETLDKINVNQGLLREAELVLVGNVNMRAILHKSMRDAQMQKIENDIEATHVTPLQQK